MSNNNIEDAYQRAIMRSADNMMTVIENNQEISDWVKNFNNDQTGFMFSDNPYMKEIMEHPLVEADGHSGASAAITLRECQRRLMTRSIQL
jgi:hypothetical protein